MTLWIVVRTGVYDQGIVGVFDSHRQADVGLVKALNLEPDTHHNFEVREFTLNETTTYPNIKSGFQGRHKL